MTDLEPVPPLVGTWYRDASGAVFEVVALDEDARTIGIQYFDGTLEVLDFDLWSETPAVPVNAPDNCLGSLDVEREDLGMELGSMLPDTWMNAVDHIDRAD